MGLAILFLLLGSSSPVSAEIPATPVMSLYRFNGELETPFFRAEDLTGRGTPSPAGSLVQGTHLIPCLVIKAGQPLMRRDGTPYVGFTLVLDPRNATPESVQQLQAIRKQRQSMRVPSHHCDDTVQHVIDARALAILDTLPRLEPPSQHTTTPPEPPASTHADADLETIVRAFHNSPHCLAANAQLLERRASLRKAWEAFVVQHTARWPVEAIRRAMHLDYAMRTALFEGHLDRGCTAYGACERNLIALSIRNRGLRRCRAWQGCRFAGDFEGVATSVSQYNIWDEYLTQTSGLASCFLRTDLPPSPRTARLQAMYAQSVADVETILYGTEAEARQLFAGTSPRDLQGLRHYYHPPAMGKCFPDRERVEYVSAAVARNADRFALLVSTWVHVDARTEDGYFFRSFLSARRSPEDAPRIVDAYPGFVVDARKITLHRPSRCTAYGVLRSCRFDSVRRHRKLPFWLEAGRPVRVGCEVVDRGAQCEQPASPTLVMIGGPCDTRMMPVADVP